MSGGMVEIYFLGQQDEYLTYAISGQEPEVKYFNPLGMYEQSSRHACEEHEETLIGAPTSGSQYVKISRIGDLVRGITLEFVSNQDLSGVYGTGKSVYDFIDNIKVEIGSQTIDTHTGDWMKICDELHTPESLKGALNYMTEGVDGTTTPQRLRLPLKFWFCKEDGYALPLCALQLHEVRITIKYTAAYTGLASIPVARCFVDHVFLNDEERLWFMNTPQTYIIEQVQRHTSDVTGTHVREALTFNHPVKELLWTVEDQSSGLANANGQITTNLTKAKIIVNGQDRMTERDADYFRYVQRYQFHTCSASDAELAGGTNNIANNRRPGIYMFSFCLEPEQAHPSGTINMSRLNTTTLDLFGSSALGKLNVYAVNYNILKIAGGVGGIGYSS